MAHRQHYIELCQQNYKIFRYHYLLFQILFCIFNSLQGFFIFLFYAARNPDVRKEWLACCGVGKDKSQPPSRNEYSNPKLSAGIFHFQSFTCNPFSVVGLKLKKCSYILFSFDKIQSSKNEYAVIHIRKNLLYFPSNFRVATKISREICFIYLPTLGVLPYNCLPFMIVYSSALLLLYYV